MIFSRKLIFLSVVATALAIPSISFAASGSLDWMRANVREEAAKMGAVKTPEVGTYTLKDESTDETSVLEMTAPAEMQFQIQLQKDGTAKSRSFNSSTVEDAIAQLDTFESQGWGAGGFSARLLLPVVIDGVKSNLSSSDYQSFSVAYYGGLIPGEPGMNPKRNRMINADINQDGSFRTVNISETWRPGLFQPVCGKELHMHVEGFAP